MQNWGSSREKARASDDASGCSVRCSRGVLSCPEDGFANPGSMYGLPGKFCRRYEGETSGDVSVWRADLLEDSSVVLEPPEARLETRTQVKGLVLMVESWTLRDGRKEQGRARAGDSFLVIRRVGRDQLVYTLVYQVATTSEDARISPSVTASVCRVMTMVVTKRVQETVPKRGQQVYWIGRRPLHKLERTVCSTYCSVFGPN